MPCRPGVVLIICLLQQVEKALKRAMSRELLLLAESEHVVPDIDMCVVVDV